jgi:hypothetical protein
MRKRKGYCRLERQLQRSVGCRGHHQRPFKPKQPNRTGERRSFQTVSTLHRIIIKRVTAKQEAVRPRSDLKTHLSHTPALSLSLSSILAVAQKGYQAPTIPVTSPFRTLIAFYTPYSPIPSISCTASKSHMRAVLEKPGNSTDHACRLWQAASSHPSSTFANT